MKFRFPACGAGAEITEDFLNSQTYDFAVEPIQPLDPDELSQKPDFSRRQVVCYIGGNDAKVNDPLQVGSQ